MFVFTNYTFAGVALLADDVAENAALFFVVIVPAVVDLFSYASRDDGQRDQLRVRVVDGRPGGFSVILENEDVAEPLVIF